MKTKLLTLLIAVSLLLSACASAAPAATPTLAATAAPEMTATTAPTATAAATAEALVVPDGMGGEIKLAGPAQKIVSLAPSNTEILFAVGAGKQVVAREDFTNYPEEAVKLPSVGGLSGKINLEQIVSYSPDLVLVAPITAAEQVKALQDLKLNVMVVPNPKTLQEMYANLELVGKATGHTDEAKKLAADLSAREKKLLEVVSKATSKPSVFYELDGSEPAKPWTSGPGTFVDMLITLAGGQNIGAELKGEWAQFSQEELIVKNPDFILLGDSNFGMTADQVKARAGWNVLKAVKDGKVLPINDDMISRPGPRMLDGLTELIKIMHPEQADALK